MKRAIKRKILKRYKKYRNRIHNKTLVRLVDSFIDFMYPDEDKLHIKYSFKTIFGYELNLNSPQTFNEKINWLKLNNRTSLHTICADKLLVRDYVSEKIGEKYLIPLIHTTKKTSEIIPEIFPDYPIIIKTNHDSGSTFIIKDKKNQDWEILREKLQESLHSNFYFANREWAYKEIPPRIITEKLLLQKDGSIPNDYRFYCSNGVVTYIQIELDRDTNHSRNIYDTNWKQLDITRGGIPSNKTLAPPKKLQEMISISEKLSSPFLFARIDLYYLDDEIIYFGEVTFTPGAGTTKFEPNKWDKIFGDTIQLPKKQLK